MRGLLLLDKVSVYGSLDLKRKIPLVSFNLKNWPPQEVAYELDQRFDIAVRAGLHCAPLIHQKLKTAPQGTVRVSLSHFNTYEDVDFFLQSAQTLLKERN
jgi:selenocysteine lyase/cysteine desulfurase